MQQLETTQMCHLTAQKNRSSTPVSPGTTVSPGGFLPGSSGDKYPSRMTGLVGQIQFHTQWEQLSNVFIITLAVCRETVLDLCDFRFSLDKHGTGDLFMFQQIVPLHVFFSNPKHLTIVAQKGIAFWPYKNMTMVKTLDSTSSSKCSLLHSCSHEKPERRASSILLVSKNSTDWKNCTLTLAVHCRNLLILELGFSVHAKDPF